MKKEYTDFKHTEITDKVIKAFYKVYNTLGPGFLEKIYEHALIIELEKMEISAKTQCPIKVIYENQIIGEYFADVLVANKVIIEIKCCQNLIPQHEAQLVNYLKATDIEIGLLLNFGINPEIKRKIYTNKEICVDL